MSLSATLWLAGCAPEPLVRTEVVEVERLVYVPVPAELTAPTPHADIPARTLFCDDLERGLRAEQAQLERCNADKGATRELAGKRAPEKRP